MIFYLGLVLFFLFIEAYFCMMEMAAISYNPIRLEYILSRGERKAVWLAHLLRRPSRLFGTTLLGINTALQFGSESSRRLYIALGFDPDLAPITQVFVVLLFGEFLPMFIGRFYPEAVVRFGIGPLYFVSKIFTPFIWMIDSLSSFIDRCFGKKGATSPYLSREELQKAFELVGEGQGNEVTRIWEGIFALEKRRAGEIARPLGEIPHLSYEATVANLRALLKSELASFVPLIDEKSRQVKGIIYPRDLLRLSDEAPLAFVAHTPCIVPEHLTLHHLLQDLRLSSQRVALVLSSKGDPTGFVTLENLLSCIGEFDREGQKKVTHTFIRRSFPKETRVIDVNALCGSHLPEDMGESLEELMIHALGHYPSRGESLKLGGLDLIFLDKGKRILVKTLLD